MLDQSIKAHKKRFDSNINDSLFQYQHKIRKEESNSSIIINKLSEKVKNDKNMFSFYDNNTNDDQKYDIMENSFQNQVALSKKMIKHKAAIT